MTSALSPCRRATAVRAAEGLNLHAPGLTKLSIFVTKPLELFYIAKRSGVVAAPLNTDLSFHPLGSRFLHLKSRFHLGLSRRERCFRSNTT